MHACKAHRRERESWHHTVIFIVEEIFRFTKSEPTLESRLRQRDSGHGSVTLTGTVFSRYERKRVL